MQTYDDKQNQSGMRVIFMVAQMVILAIVYSVIYTSFKAVQFTIEKFDGSASMYLPIVIAMIVFPVLLYRYRQMFYAGKMLLASIKMMASAFLIVILLYVYIAQIVS